MFTMSYTSGVWRDDPGCLCVFSWHCELQKGPVLGPDQAVLRRLTLGGRTVPTPFFAAQRVTARDRVTPRDRGFRPRHRTTLCSHTSQVSASSVWARHSETLLTPDCAASARAEATVQSFQNYTNVEVMSTTAIYNLPIRGDCPDDPGSYLQSLQWFPFIIRHITLMGKGWVSNAFDGWTNVFPDAW